MSTVTTLNVHKLPSLKRTVCNEIWYTLAHQQWRSDRKLSKIYQKIPCKTLIQRQNSLFSNLFNFITFMYSAGCQGRQPKHA